MGRRAAVALGVGLVGAQAGHLVAFQLRFGSAAQQLQSSGAHAYFPAVAKTTLGVLAAGLLVTMFVIGLARVLAPGSVARRGSAPRYIELVAALFTIQLVTFMAQEVGEALVAGTAAESASHLLLWGTLGQLPVAAIAAVALRWLGTRLESAALELRGVLVAEPDARALVPVVLALWHAATGALLLARVAGHSLDKRGPPSSLRLSS
jgi:FtsH-binding integral membrane protein